MRLTDGRVKEKFRKLQLCEEGVVIVLPLQVQEVHQAGGDQQGGQEVLSAEEKGGVARWHGVHKTPCMHTYFDKGFL